MLRTLLGTDLWIEQNSRQAFNLDTILLQHFIKIPVRTKTILDVGTGVGPLMLYLSKRTKAKIIGVEIQEARYHQALKNIALNHLEHQLSCMHLDVKQLLMKDVDLIVTNPPFFKTTETSNKSEDEDDLIARHEVTLNLEELISSSSRLLKFGGYLTMIHRPDRFAEMTDLFNRYGFQVKRVRFVHPYLNHPANHLLIEAMKNGNPGMLVEPPLILYVDKHILTKEMVDIYGGR
ncbi:MAG: methyltransferase domain-containing protein [Acholeplasma sp.]|jgi:tRNA1(Val) A37 N6-methylase TrmN6|nr:MAG: methyltransferase domain-containing protein [Acholeplasma sp.]